MSNRLDALPLKRHAIVALTLLSVCNGLNYMDRLAVTVVAQPLKTEFGLTDTQLGFLNGPAFVAIYIFSSILIGRMVDRFNRKRIIAGVLALWSFMTLAGGLATSFGTLLLARLGVGVGEGGSNPGSLSILSDYYPVERRSMALAIFATVGMVGMLASLMGGGWVAANYGWRSFFFLACAPGIAIALLILLFLREPPRGRYDPQTYQPLSTGEAFRTLWHTPAFPRLIVGMGLGTFGSLGMLQWLPVFFIRSHHLSVAQVGLFFGPAVVGGLIIGQIVGGWLGDRAARISTGHMLIPAIVSLVVHVPLTWITLWAPSLTVALLFTVLAGAISVLWSPAAQAVVQTIAPPSARATGVASMNFVTGTIGQAIMPFIVGLLSDAFAPSFGADALRMALTLCITISFASALLLVTVKTKLDRIVALRTET